MIESLTQKVMNPSFFELFSKVLPAFEHELAIERIP